MCIAAVPECYLEVALFVPQDKRDDDESLVRWADACASLPPADVIARLRSNVAVPTSAKGRQTWGTLSSA